MADETPPPPRPAVPQTVPHTPPVAIWSLILAVLSFTCGWLFTAIPAVICGHIARAKIRKSGGALGGRGIATAGLILGYIALVLGIMGIPLLVSIIQSDRERLQRLSTERKEIASDDSK
jgi:threonine/homoserine/homoserine lactone efflux protein